MTQSQKEIISQMLAAGEKTAKIAEALGISPNTIKSYLRRKKQDGCPNCGKPLIQLPHKRKKKNSVPVAVDLLGGENRTLLPECWIILV